MSKRPELSIQSLSLKPVSAVTSAFWEQAATQVAAASAMQDSYDNPPKFR
jgi:hypothetical protein